MLNIKKRIILSFVINILMVLIFISAIANEIVDIYVLSFLFQKNLLIKKIYGYPI